MKNHKSEGYIHLRTSRQGGPAECRILAKNGPLRKNLRLDKTISALIEKSQDRTIGNHFHADRKNHKERALLGGLKTITFDLPVTEARSLTKSPADIARSISLWVALTLGAFSFVNPITH